MRRRGTGRAMTGAGPGRAGATTPEPGTGADGDAPAAPADGEADETDDPRDVHRRLLALSPPARRLLAGTVACGAVAAVAVIVQAWVVAGTIADAVAGTRPVTGALIVLGLAIAVRALAAGLTELFGRRAAQHAMHELRTRIAGRALRGRAGGTDEARRGDVVTAAVQGVDALADYYARAIPAVALAGGVPLVVIAAIAWRQPVVGGLLAITLPVLVLFMVLVGRTSADHARERQRALAVLGAHFLEVVRALPTLRAHGRDAAQVQTLDAVAERYREESLGALRVAFLSALVLELFAMLGIAVAAATVGVLLATGHAELSTGLFVLLLAPEVYAPLRAAGQRFHAAEDGAQAARRALAFLDEPATLSTRRTTEAAPDPALLPVRLRAVGVRGGAGRPDALAALHLELEPGRSVALVGPSGAGKSTLLRLLARLQDPTSGTVTCGGVDLQSVAPEAWWAGLAWLPQRPTLPAGTLREALAAAAGVDPGLLAPGARFARALSLADADGVLATMPAGLDTPVGPGGRVLSAGQTQRLALAGALASRAPLVLLDEPTAHLDPGAAGRVADGIVAACAGRTLVVATHDPVLIDRCDRVVRIAAGSLATIPGLRGEPAVGAAR